MNINKSKKPFILLCDDKKHWTKKFGWLHGYGIDKTDIEIEEIIKNESERGLKNDIEEFVNDDVRGPFRVLAVNNALDFEQVLQELLQNNDKPDIIMIDLYHPINENATENIANGQKAIEELQDAIIKARSDIEKAWSKVGLSMLQQARNLLRKYGDAKDLTPIAIYTEQGLTLASEEKDKNHDKSLDIVSNLKGHWFLKGQTPFYERAKLKAMLSAVTREELETVLDEKFKFFKKIVKKTSWLVAGGIFILSVIYLWKTGKSIDEYILSALTSFAIAFLIPTLVEQSERKNK